MLILRYLAGFMVWFTICFVDAALLGCTLYAFNMAGLLAKAGQWGAQVAAQLPTDVDPTGAYTRLPALRGATVCAVRGGGAASLCCEQAWMGCCRFAMPCRVLGAVLCGVGRRHEP
jgi:hypothetical protein